MIRLQAAVTDCDWEQFRHQKIKIHSVYHQVMNLAGDKDEFFSVIQKNYERFPGAIVLSDSVDFTQLPVQAGQPVRYDRKCLYFCNEIEVSLEHAVQVSMNSIRRGSQPDRRLVERILQLIKIYGRKSELYDALLEQKSETAQERMFHEGLQRLFIMQKQGKAEYDASVFLPLVGLGCGLTPAGDDFLAGLFLAARYLGAEWFVKKDWSTLLQYVRENTSVVSYQMIKNALRGYARESVIQLFEAIRKEDWNEIKGGIHKVIAYGSTSGTDMLCGVLCGLMPFGAI